MSTNSSTLHVGPLHNKNFMTQSKKDKELRLTVQAKYEQIVRNQGELFDRRSIPMNESDKAEVKKKQRLVVFVLVPLLLFLLSGTLYFIWDGTLSSYLVLGSIALVVIFGAISYFNYEYVLKSNSKDIIKGVLTNKQRIDDGDTVDYDFEISNKDVVSVSRSTFKKFSIGDIVEIELLSSQNGLSLKTNVKRIGTVFDDVVNNSLTDQRI